MHKMDDDPAIVTGGVSFISMRTVERMSDRGETVIGVDVFNDYYDPALNGARAARLEGREGFRMVRADIADNEQAKALVAARGEPIEVYGEGKMARDVNYIGSIFGVLDNSPSEGVHEV